MQSMTHRVAVNISGAAQFMGDMDFFAKVEFARSCGVNAVEAHPCREWPAAECSLIDLSGAAVKRVREGCRGLDCISVHAQMGATVADDDPAVRAQVVQWNRTAVRDAAFLGARVVVVHCHMAKIAEPDVRGRVIESMRDLADYADAFGVRICLETPTDLREPALFAALIRDIDHPNLGATIDTGHLRSCLDDATKRSSAVVDAYNDVLFNLTRDVLALGKLFHVHLNDIRAETLADHYGIGLGFVDFERVLGAIQADGYEGMLVLEIHRGPAGEVGDITAEEFRAAVHHVLAIVG